MVMNMEIRLYHSLNDFSKGKYFLCSKVVSPDTFDFSSALSVFKSIYGINVIVCFVCVNL